MKIMKTALTELIEELESKAQGDDIWANVNRAFIEIAKKYLEKEKEQLERARKEGYEEGYEETFRDNGGRY